MKDKTNVLLEAARNLCNKMDVIHNDERYKGIWISAHVHGVSYEGGPTYEHELAALKKAIGDLGLG